MKKANVSPVHTDWASSDAAAAVSFIVNALLAFVFSSATVLSGCSPFGIAYTAACSRMFAIPSALGAAVGYLVSFDFNVALKYLGILVVILLLRGVFVSKSVEMNSFFSMSIAFFSATLCGVVFVFLSKSDGYAFIMTVSEALLAGGLAFFFYRTLKRIFPFCKLSSLGNMDMISLGISVCAVIAAMASFEAFGYSIGTSVAILLILAVGIQSTRMSCIAAVMAAAALTLAMPEKALFFSVLPFCALIASSFRKFGKLSIAAGFILSCGVSILIIGATPQTLGGLVDVAVATVAFMVFPLERWAVFKSDPAGGLSFESRAAGESISGQLRFASDMMSEAGSLITEVSRRIGRMTGEDVSALFYQAADHVCKDCSLHPSCFGSCYNDTQSVFNDAAVKLREKGRIATVDLPYHFTGRCSRGSKICDEVNRSFAQQISKKRIALSVSEAKRAMTEQFSAISSLLFQMSREIHIAFNFESEAAEKLSDILDRLSIPYCDLSCYRDKNDRIFIGFTTAKPLSEDKLSELYDGVCTVFDEPFSAPFVTQVKNRQKVLFCQKENFELCPEAVGQTKSGSGYCGDCFDSFRDGKGNHYMLLSDGMGSGGRAAVDANLTVSLLRKLLEAQMPFEAAVKTVSSALLMRAGDEAVCTLDFVCVDLFTGEASFAKAGAATSWVRKDKEIQKINMESAPLGILETPVIRKLPVTLSEGDILVMVSDGITDTDDGWLSELLLGYRGGSESELAKAIIAESQNHTVKGQEDDKTVAVAIVRENS